MARRCTVCASDARPQIEIGLVSGVSTQVLADRFGLSKDSVGRHARNHLTPSQAAALLMASQPEAIDLDQLTEREGSNLLLNLVHARARLAEYGRAAAEGGLLGAAIQAERAVTANLEVTGKLLSKFVLRSEHRTVNLHLSADYLDLRAKLIAAIAPFPQVRDAVTKALTEADLAVAKQIEGKLAIGATP